MPPESTNGQRIRSLADLDALDAKSQPLCLYSGGLDGTYLLYRLSRLKFQKIFALRVGLGGDPSSERAARVCEQLRIDFVPREKEDLFAEKYVIPAIRSQARYLGGHPICASLSRPLIAAEAVAVAAECKATCIIHTSDRSQNSLRRFNGALRGLGYDGDYGSPFEDDLISREEKRAELENAGITGFSERVYSGDSNLWGREFEAAGLDDPENIRVPEDLYRWTRRPAHSDPSTVSITFRNGTPVQVDGRDLNPVQIIQHLNSLAGSFGLGRFIGLEEIACGSKVQEVREMPAAYLLLDAYRRLEAACLSAETIRAKIGQEQVWVREAVEGRWYGVLREAADAFIARTSRDVSGRITYRLCWLDAQPISVVSTKPLYVRDRANVA